MKYQAWHHGMCFGGPADGKRRFLNHGDRLFVSYPLRLSATSDADMNQPVPIAVYKRVRLTQPGGTSSEFYVWEFVGDEQ